MRIPVKHANSVACLRTGISHGVFANRCNSSIVRNSFFMSLFLILSKCGLMSSGMIFSRYAILKTALNVEKYAAAVLFKLTDQARPQTFASDKT